MSPERIKQALQGDPEAERELREWIIANPMTDEQREAQRQSWVRGELELSKDGIDR